MFKKERRELIFKYIRENQRTTVAVLATIFQVTKETIRSDLAYLEKQRLIKRFYGGAYFFQEQAPLTERSGVTDLMRNLGTKHKKNMKTGKKMKRKICILGSFNVDIVARVSRFPKSGETIIAVENTLGPGGKGCNQAMAAFFADGDVHFFAKVGDDYFSQFARNHFKSSGMDSYTLYETKDAPTGSAVIYVCEEDGENIIAIAPGANQTIGDEEICALRPYLAESGFLLAQLENNIDAVVKVIKLASSLGNTIVVNPAPYSPEICAHLAYIDMITPNETEAGQLSGIDITDLESAKQAALKIADMGVKQVLITLGSRGVLVLDKGVFQHVPAFPAVAVDTTGAGDAFNGALVAALAKGDTLMNAVRYAAAFASLAVEREGAANMPDDEQVRRRLKNSADF